MNVRKETDSLGEADVRSLVPSHTQPPRIGGPAPHAQASRSQAAVEEAKIFRRILVAYDGSSESERALLTGIQLAKSFNAELRAVSVIENLPPYAAYIDADLPGATAELRQQTAQHYQKIQVHAQQTARQEDVELMTELVQGDEVQAIVECVQRTQSDLLVLGIHRHSWLLFSRLLNHTTHDLSQQAASSILAVH